MCVLFMSWWVTYWQIEHCLPIPRLVGGSKLPGARILSRQSLLSEIYWKWNIYVNALLVCYIILYWSWWPRLFVGTPGTRTTWWWTRRCKPSRAASMKNLRRCYRGGRIENHFHFLNNLRQQRSFLVMFDTLISQHCTAVSKIDIDMSGKRLHDPIFLVQVRPGCCEKLDASHRQCPWVAGPRLHRVLWVRGRWDFFNRALRVRGNWNTLRAILWTSPFQSVLPI